MITRNPIAASPRHPAHRAADAVSGLLTPSRPCRHPATPPSRGRRGAAQRGSARVVAAEAWRRRAAEAAWRRYVEVDRGGGPRARRTRDLRTHHAASATLLLGCRSFLFAKAFKVEEPGVGSDFPISSRTPASICNSRTGPDVPAPLAHSTEHPQLMNRI